MVSFEQALKQRGIESGRRTVGATGLIGEARDSEGVIAGQELVAGLPTDAVRGTELGDGDHPAQRILDELLTELHGVSLMRMSLGGPEVLSSSKGDDRESDLTTKSHWSEWSLGFR